MCHGNAGAQHAAAGRSLCRAIDFAIGIRVVNPPLRIDTGVAVAQKSVRVDVAVDWVYPTVQRDAPCTHVQAALARGIEGCVGLAISESEPRHRLLLRDPIVDASGNTPLIGVKALIGA